MHFTLQSGPRSDFPGLSTHVNAFTIIAAACVLPLCLLRNWQQSAVVLILGNTALFVVCRVVYASIYELADSSEVPSQPAHNVTMMLLGEAMRPDVQAFNQRTFSMFFGLMVFSFAIQCLTFGLEGDVKDKKDFLRKIPISNCPCRSALWIFWCRMLHGQRQRQYSLDCPTRSACYDRI